MTQALNLANFANKLNSSGQADNTSLQGGTYPISISGSAATATSAESAATAGTAGYATTAGNGGVTSVDSATGDVILSNLSSFAKSLSTNGYQKLPGGLILQWGTVGSVNVGTSVAFTFPITFPNTCFGVWENPNTSVSGGNNSIAYGWSTTGATVYNGQNSSANVAWFSIGY